MRQKQIVFIVFALTWTVKARDARRITAAEMKYMRRTAGYSWTDYKTWTVNPLALELDIYILAHHLCKM